MTLRKQIKSASKDQLNRLVIALYGIHSDIDDIIERHLAAATETGPSEASDELATMLHRQIEQLRREDEFIDYRSGYAFSCRLESLLVDINTLLREQDLAQALQLTEDFLALEDNILTRCDDSDGDVGYTFRGALDQWLDIATELRSVEPDARDWVALVLHYFHNNDYGVFDDVISHSRPLLTVNELQQLAQGFEQDASKALENSNDTSYNSEASHACIGLQSVAKALDDIGLFEKATLLKSPIPNTRQLGHIIDFAIERSHFERAEHWLQQPQWQEDPSYYKQMRNRLLEAQGNLDALKENLKQDFLQTPCSYHLRAYWDIATRDEQPEIKKTAESLIKARLEKPDNVPDIIEMLLILGSLAKAQQIVVQYYSALKSLYFSTYLGWLERFSEKDHSLACVVCYRLLLLDLLDRGYAKAYHHGGRYFNKLLALDTRINNYETLLSAEDFIRQIQQEHWRKRSFWAEADYPNKTIRS